MPTNVTYDAHVAARTRAAAEILRVKELLDLYEAHGGLREDLEEIRTLGLKAEALSQTRSGAKAARGSATLTVLESFATLQKEYGAVMAVVRAVKRDLEVKGAPAEVVQSLDTILVNEAAVVIRPVPSAAGEDEGGKKPRRRGVRSNSQEAIRAEIQRDAAALIELKGAHAALARRKVTLPRLKKLRDDTQSLADQLGARTTHLGAAKAATATLRDSVRAQKQAWSAAYRILYAVGHDDQRIRQLLSETTYPRTPRKR